MTTEQLRGRLGSKPFRPFVLRTADGAKLRVSHPEAAWLSPGGRTAVIATGNESFEIVDVLMITAIEIGNGRGRRRSGS